ncbi:hypothetical protein L484_012822 [Morus notabilis]|uniref:Uncharacterized protein n=1 Tax=Morus notabilis TaxID=981085 RepID=W9QTW1_9ROSA|nr:hypothetical protein L484_012822 [Morus notabilis]
MKIEGVAGGEVVVSGKVVVVRVGCNFKYFAHDGLSLRQRIGSQVGLNAMVLGPATGQLDLQRHGVCMDKWVCDGAVGFTMVGYCKADVV